jgi:replicative superfamily II helicase
MGQHHTQILYQPRSADLHQRVHLLYDEHRLVSETIVSRMLRRVEQTRVYLLLVALSGMLPNYQDVVKLLKVDLKKGLFWKEGIFQGRPA